MIAVHGGRAHGGVVNRQSADGEAPNSIPGPICVPYGETERGGKDREKGRKAVESTVRVIAEGGVWNVPPPERPPLLRPYATPPRERGKGPR